MTARLFTSRSLLPLAGLVLVLAAPLRAQDASLVPLRTLDSVSVATPKEVSQSPVAGPTRESSAVAVRQPLMASANSHAAPATRQGMGKPFALMAVGGAAVLTGLLIGRGAGYAIAVGGAVVGLYGLYQYLQ